MKVVDESLRLSLETNTGEQWDMKRVFDDFVIPIEELVEQGHSYLDAEVEVWKRLGIVSDSELSEVCVD